MRLEGRNEIWKDDNSKSYMNHPDKNARYLNVTQDYLLYENGTADSPDSPVDVPERMDLYLRIPDDDKRFLRRIAETFVKLGDSV